MTYAPIIIFAFNRLGVLKKTVASLCSNEESKDSDLYVFVDGARSNKSGEEEKVVAVRNFVKTIKGFRNLYFDFSDKNRGLGASIIRGVSQVIARYGKVIVIEDDLILAPNFLAFMNQGLEDYKDNQKVFSICGYSNRIKVPESYPYNAYFCTRSSSWGWGTWIDRWETVDWELKNWESCISMARKFNSWGGTDCWNMLYDWHKGKNKSWAIRFCFTQFLQNKLSLFPLVSKVDNEGFDGEGTNCKKWSRFKFDFDKSGSKVFMFPSKVEQNMIISHSALAYHSLVKRIWSRIMYLIYK